MFHKNSSRSFKETPAFVSNWSSQFKTRIAQCAHMQTRAEPRRYTEHSPTLSARKVCRKIKYFLVYITTKIRQSPLSPGLGGLRGERLLRLFTNKSLFQFSIPRRQGRVLGPGRAGSSAAALQVPPGPAPAALVLLPQPPSPASLRR